MDIGLGDNRIHLVTETQFRDLLGDGLQLLLDLKFNEFLPKGWDLGLGVGLQYKF